MKKKITAVEWLVEQFDLTSDSPIIKNVVDQAKAMEKQHIVDAVDGHPIQNRHLDGEQYYNETYVKD